MYNNEKIYNFVGGLADIFEGQKQEVVKIEEEDEIEEDEIEEDEIEEETALSETNSFEIKTHNFRKAKKSLKELLKETEKNVHLSRVEEDGLIPIFDHIVTGKELNKLVVQLKDGFIDFNKKHAKVAKELREVYIALEALDSDYISAIVMNMEAIEKTSNDAKRIAEQTSKNTQKIQKTIQTQKKTIEVLGKFKEQLDELSELDKLEELIIQTMEQRKQLKIATTISTVSIVVAVVSVALHFVGI